MLALKDIYNKTKMLSFFNQFRFVSANWEHNIIHLVTKGYTVESIKQLVIFLSVSSLKQSI